MEVGNLDFMLKANFNLPNVLTVLRVLLVPFFIYFLIQDDFFFRLYALIIFLLASFTDLIDGYLARKWKQETEFGKFLDPLADKILVVSSFLTFILLDEQIELWMVLLIILRDMLITSLRWLAIRSGTSLHTTMMGKIKTAFQMGAIFVILVLFMAVSTKQRNAINEDAQVRERLKSKGIPINKPVCKDPKETSCTTVGGLPEGTIQMLEDLQTYCNGGVYVTGGTEYGHSAHGPNKPTVDLSIGDGKLNACIRSFAAGIPMGFCHATYKKFGYTFCDEKSSQPHWHVDIR
jgi:CDP-diacylglycerol--glycerol-3-phosphate 3-phosphatidyltransferase